jgi:hypothetical protein
MRFEIKRANLYAWNDADLWEVERVHDAGERYLVGRFRDPVLAESVAEVLNQHNVEYEYGKE